MAELIDKRIVNVKMGDRVIPLETWTVKQEPRTITVQVTTVEQQPKTIAVQILSERPLLPNWTDEDRRKLLIPIKRDKTASKKTGGGRG
jgi:hypothetical protein